MFKVDKYPHGLFCWVDGQSTDVAKSKAFYHAVMGWTSEDIPIGEGMSYTMFFSDGEAVAGMGAMPQEMQAQGVPSHWNSYINVEDVDALVPKVTELGGTLLMQPMDVMDSGRMVFLRDPSGGNVGLWQAKQHKGSGLVNTPGALCWNELITQDTRAARDFYAGLFDWNYDKIDMEMEYNVIMNGKRPNGGIMPTPEQMAGTPPVWFVYFSVADVDKVAENAKAAGGNVMGEVMDTPPGRMVVIADPTGMTAAFIQLEEPQPWES